MQKEQIANKETTLCDKICETFSEDLDPSIPFHTNNECFEELDKSQTVTMLWPIFNISGHLNETSADEHMMSEKMVIEDKDKENERDLHLDISNSFCYRVNDINIFDEQYMLRIAASQLSSSHDSQDTDVENMHSSSPSRRYIKRLRKGDTKIYKLTMNLKPRKTGESEFTRKSSFYSLDSRSESVSTLNILQELTETERILRCSINTISRDNTLLFSAGDGVPKEPNRDWIIRCIGKILAEILEAFNKGFKPSFIMRRKTFQNCVLRNNR